MDLHGGNIYRIFRENKIEKVLDYSSNINPFGVPESLKKGMMESMEVLEKYPDPEYYELRKKFAEYNDVKIENVLVGNGATELIFLYMKVIKPKKVLILSPTFAEYERGIKSAVPECSIEYFDLDMEKDFVLNVEILKKELAKKYDLVVMCNPNNPTGKFISASEAEDLLSECDKYGTKLFIDEAFIEFVSGGIKSSLIFGKADKKSPIVYGAKLEDAMEALHSSQPAIEDIQDYHAVGQVIGCEFFTDGNDTILLYNALKHRALCVNFYS